LQACSPYCFQFIPPWLVCPSCFISLLTSSHISGTSPFLLSISILLCLFYATHLLSSASYFCDRVPASGHDSSILHDVEPRRGTQRFPGCTSCTRARQITDFRSPLQRVVNLKGKPCKKAMVQDFCCSVRSSKVWQPLLDKFWGESLHDDECAADFVSNTKNMHAAIASSRLPDVVKCAMVAKDLARIPEPRHRHRTRYVCVSYIR
jgi:hypothetical protein